MTQPRTSTNLLRVELTNQEIEADLAYPARRVQPVLHAGGRPLPAIFRFGRGR